MAKGKRPGTGGMPAEPAERAPGKRKEATPAVGPEPAPVVRATAEQTWTHLPSEHWDPSRIHPQAWNPRKPFTPEMRARLKRGLAFYGWVGGANVRVEDGMLIGGHKRFEVALEIIAELKTARATPQEFARLNFPGGFIPVIPIEGMPDKVAMALNVALNNREVQGEFNVPTLAELVSYLDGEGFDATLTGYDGEQLEDLLTWSPPGAPGGDDEEEEKRSLVEKFGVPPFTVFDSRQGYWQDRKRAWNAVGIASQEGRATGLLAEAELMREINDGTSIFDPVLCELAYRWFCPKGGTILDPFAGGSVRGIVAAMLGRKYVGIDLRPEQVAANQRQAAQIVTGPVPQPEWILGNSHDITELAKHHAPYDFIFTCPPYYNLEQYSKDPSDLSNLASYQQFRREYTEIIGESCKLLKDDAFAIFVVGEIRDENGHYRNFVGDTVEAFRGAGLHYYNEAVLLTAIGTLPVRAGRIFEAARKLGKTHQNAVMFEKSVSFIKGDAKKATAALGPVEFGDPEKAAEAEAALDAPTESDNA